MHERWRPQRPALPLDIAEDPENAPAGRLRLAEQFQRCGLLERAAEFAAAYIP